MIEMRNINMMGLYLYNDRDNNINMMGLYHSDDRNEEYK